MLVIDRQHDVCHHVGDLVVGGQVERSHSHRSDHVLDFRVVSDHAEVLDVVLTHRRRVFADALGKEATRSMQTESR